jgi:dihydroorotate dehydrogenase electron transfer subunit
MIDRLGKVSRGIRRSFVEENSIHAVGRRELLSMIQTHALVTDCQEIQEGIFLLSFRSPEIARGSAPGQFVNIRCSNGCLPLLRRPFSISRVAGDSTELMFNVVGQGTTLLSKKKAGDDLDVLGPLGSPFKFQGDFDTAILVGGGLGVAPFPFLTDALLREKKNIQTIIGARSSRQLAERHLLNVQVATDDGSRGFRGTVIDLLKTVMPKQRTRNTKIFGCGPTKMLSALSEFAREKGIECELSLEGDMACGMGLCQGCPVERVDGKKYSLVCVEGPTFNSKDIVLR